jgi:hypothetical protein
MAITFGQMQVNYTFTGWNATLFALLLMTDGHLCGKHCITSQYMGRQAGGHCDRRK